MNLTPQEKAIGRENYNTVAGQQISDGESRRDFIKKGLLAGAVSGAGLGAFYYGYDKSLGKPLRVAVLGTGDEGSVLIGALNPEFHEVKAIADIRPYSVHRAFHGDWYSEPAHKARPGLMSRYGWKSEDEARKHVKVYKDYRELLESEKDIEAVVIALPLHLHAEAAVAAMKRGLHVLTEKLMGQTVHQCKEMARVAEDLKVYLAVGHQRHYNVLYDNAKEMIRSGLLGDLHYIRAQWHRGNMPGNDSWSQPLPPGVKSKEEDKNFDRLARELKSWEKELERTVDARTAVTLKQRIEQKKAQIADIVLHKPAEGWKSAKDYGYEDKVVKDSSGKEVYSRPAIEELIRWRLWDRTSAGLMAELGSHQLDAASIFVAAAHGGKKQLPLSVSPAATRPLFPPDRDVEDHVFCIVEFPAPGYKADDPIDSRKKIGVQYASINGNGFGGYGEVVFGTKGTLIIEKELEAMLFKDADTESKVGVTKGKGGPTLDTQASGAAPAAAAVGALATANVSRGYAEELEHWAWCVRNPSPEHQPHCTPKVAMGDAIIALVTNMAARQGTRIAFKPEWFDPHDDATPEGVKPDLSRYK